MYCICRCFGVLKLQFAQGKMLMLPKKQAKVPQSDMLKIELIDLINMEYELVVLSKMIKLTHLNNFY